MLDEVALHPQRGERSRISANDPLSAVSAQGRVRIEAARKATLAKNMTAAICIAFTKARNYTSIPRKNEAETRSQKANGRPLGAAAA
jgi:hypothetical protein